ncbi:MAG TPA: glycosyltransferase 87 family protein [Conexibacter sp.]|nr:glycosyltransferase 87 family protein [Conexibacter sp.]
MRSHLRRPSALLVAVLVLLVAWAALSATRTSPRTLPHAAAVRAVLENPRAARQLTHGERWTRVQVGAVDGTTTRVTFFDGPRILAQAAVRPNGSVERFVEFRRQQTPYGVPLTYRPLVIGVAALAFVLATAVLPLRRLRNLDVAALLALVVPVVLLDERLVEASTLAAVPPLLWLTGRCAWRALGRQRDSTACLPLLDALTPAWSDAQRVRILRLAVGVAAACTAMIAVSAQSTVDVGQALMEGATLLVHGTLPYGNMPGDVFHGDVYPLFSYAVYAPLALAMPVHDAWDVANGALVVAAGAAVAGAWLLARLVARDATPAGPQLAARAAGLRAALAWLTLPPLLVTVSTGTSDVLLGALLLAALLTIRRPLTSTAFVVAAGWFKVVPFALLPIWLARLRGRRLLAALALTAGSAAIAVAALVALGGVGAPEEMLHAVAYQLERRTLHAPLELLGLDGLQPLGQAAVLALIAGATVRVRRDPELAADPVRLAALSGAVLLGLQLTGNYWTFLYLAWAVPCVLVGLHADRPASARAPVSLRTLNPVARTADSRSEAASAAVPLPS